jgi:hypothetical protein
VKSEGTKGRERVVGKAAGRSASLYLAKGWAADEARFHAMPDTRRAVTPDAVIHRNMANVVLSIRHHFVPQCMG